MDTTEAQARPSAVQRFLKTPPPPRHEPEVEEAEAYLEALSRGRESLMLDVRLLDGTIVSFDYAHLVKSKFSPEGRIVLRFGGDQVTAEGKNLKLLYGAITEHRQKFIQEGTDAEERLKPEDAAHIDKIVITEAFDKL